MPLAIDGLVGEIDSDAITAAVTVSVVCALAPRSVAPMVVEPTPTPSAAPLEPALFEIDATSACEDDHVTDAVASCVLLSV